MGVNIVFFGKSQDFSSKFYDSSGPITDFNLTIKDFDLLESKYFTVDDVKNKEILSKYFFVSQGKRFCLIKLYSFAQAYDGNRIAGSIYGVGLLSEHNIKLSKDNLDLLRAAKDNFAKLSLDGFKFNKSNFQNDTDRIWNAIVKGPEGNLLSRIKKLDFPQNISDGQVAYFVKNLFDDAVKLDERITNKSSVYFSEDIEHLKRTQSRWGGDIFPIFWEQNNQLISYKDPITEPLKSRLEAIPEKSIEVSNISKLKSELLDSQYQSKILEEENKKMSQKIKVGKNVIIALLCLILILFILLISDSDAEKKVNKVGELKEAPSKELHHPKEVKFQFVSHGNVDSGIEFLHSIKYVYSFEPRNPRTVKDTVKLKNEFQKLFGIAKHRNIDINEVVKEYRVKFDSINKLWPNQTLRKSKEVKTKGVN